MDFGLPLVSLWFPFDFLLLFLWVSFGFPLDFLGFPFAFLLVFRRFPFVFFWFPFGFPLGSLWFSLWLLLAASDCFWLLLVGLVYYHDLHHRSDGFCPEPRLTAPGCTRFPFGGSGCSGLNWSNSHHDLYHRIDLFFPALRFSRCNSFLPHSFLPLIIPFTQHSPAQLPSSWTVPCPWTGLACRS